MRRASNVLTTSDALDRCVSIHPIAVHSTPVISTDATVTIKPMFVRWKIRRLRRPELDGQPAGLVRYAVLVECVRREGKPRQKVLCHLAHIRERHKGSALRRAAFWQAVDRRLMLLNLDAPVRAVIESKLAVIAPRPMALELEEMRRRFVAGRAKKSVVPMICNDGESNNCKSLGRVVATFQYAENIKEFRAFEITGLLSNAF